MSRLPAYVLGVLVWLLCAYALLFYALYVAFSDEGTSVLSPLANATQLLLAGVAFIAANFAIAAALSDRHRSKVLLLSVVSAALLAVWAIVIRAMVGGSF